MQSYMDGSTSGLVIALVACGCSAAPGPTSHGPTTLSPASAGGFAPIWVNTDLHPIGPAKAVGANIVGIIVDDFRLFLVGIDPATGRERWRRGMAHSNVTPGEPVEVTPIALDKLAYLRPAGGDYAQLVVADASNGEDLASSPPHIFTSWPFACANGKDACAVSHGIPGGRAYRYRLDVAGDDYVTDSDAITAGARLLMVPGLLDLGDRPGNTLAWLRDGNLQWRTPISAAFPPGFSSDYGWTWRTFADPRVIVGSVFGRPIAQGRGLDTDLSQAGTAGLSEVTGEVLWRDSGSSLDCRLPESSLPVRCRSTGFAHFRDGQATFDSLSVTVEGFDPMTGKTTWSLPLGGAEALVYSRVPLAIAGPTQVVLGSSRGPLVLDYAAGRATPPAPGASFWCLTSSRYDTYPAYSSGWDSTRRTDRPGGKLAATCDDQRRATTQLPGAEATRAAGAQVGSYVVIAASRGYIGFRLR